MCVEKCVTFCISYLKNNNLLFGNYTNRTMRWSDGSSITYSLSSYSRTDKAITLNYSVDGQIIKYIVRLSAVSSNLENVSGVRWYFICPITKRRCMKLIKPYNSLYFAHRTAHKILYEQQMGNGGFWDVLGRTTTAEEKRDEALNEIKKKYRKTHYRGKPTPLARKIIKYNRIAFSSESKLNFSAINALDNLEFDEIEDFEKV